MIRVELIRAWPHVAEIVCVELADHATVADALTAGGWALQQEFIGLAVYGVAATLTTTLQDGDRVELLRGLQVDPKQARRLRAQRSGKASRA